MRRGWKGGGLPAAGVVLGALSLASIWAGPRTAPDTAPRRLTYEYGERLFLHETFQGNGRTCATCHVPRAEFSITPQLVQQRYELDPNDPLFRPIDSDDGQGQDYTTLLTHAVFRVTVPLHPNVVVLGDPERRTITVRRGAPSISNVTLTAPYLQDGRAPTLEEQALGAIVDHLEPGRVPLPRELVALRMFESEIYYPLRLRALGDDTDPVPLEPDFSVPIESPAALRGKAAFDFRCRRCHGGELRHEPESPDTPQFSDVFVSEANRPRFPLLRLGFRQPDGTVIEAVTPDPGRAAVTGDLLDLNAFDTPPLRGVKHTAPYFHDNSAATLREVVEHYNESFQFHMTLQEQDDLISYLELL